VAGQLADGPLLAAEQRQAERRSGVLGKQPARPASLAAPHAGEIMAPICGAFVSVNAETMPPYGGWHDDACW
jgi:hypothetical protein